MKIDLFDCPNILQDETKAYLSKYEYTKVICVTMVETTPYIDKSIINTIYTVSIEQINYFTSLRFIVCSKEEWSDREVLIVSMNTSQISDIIKNSEIFACYIKEH